MQQRRKMTGGLFGFMALGLFLVAASQAQAQTTANGPYYATPSWDQTLPAATRFIILSNFAGAAVLDRNTGLVWEKSPATTSATWSGARFLCINSIIGGQRGWRLPSVVELSSLIDLSLPAPFVPFTVFTGVRSATYWSATTYTDVSSDAWAVNFFSSAFAGSGLTINNDKSGHAQIWCVRGAMNADQY